MRIETLTEKFNLGKLIEKPKEVKGGLLHKMYEVKTDRVHLAIKEFNSMIMKREGVLEKLEITEEISSKLNDRIPVINAIKENDNYIIEYDGFYYMLFPWLEGSSLFFGEISRENCFQIGRILGEIHSSDIEIKSLEREEFKVDFFNWDSYLIKGMDQQSNWLDDYIKLINKIKSWNSQAKEVCGYLNENLVISHRDLDPKNVMWSEDKPYIIDWESAGYVNPYQELLEVLCYWSEDGQGNLIKEKFQAIIKGYREVVHKNEVQWEKIFHSGYVNMLGWLDYSFKRSLGIEASSDEERELGTTQVFSTMLALENYERNILKMREWLKN